MPSRETRRIKERLTGKKDEKGKIKQFNPLTIPSVIIIGLVLLGLIWWGGSRGSVSSGDIVFAVYDGRPVSWSYGNYFARKISEAAQLNQGIEPERMVSLLLPYMIFHTAAMMEAEKSGISVTEKEVEDYIVNIGMRESYNRADSIVRHELFDTYREELIELKVLENMIQPYADAGLQDFAAAMGKKERKFRFVQWLYDEYPTQEIIAFAKEHTDLFRRIKLTPLVIQEEGAAREARNKIITDQSTFDQQLEMIGTGESGTAASRDWLTFHSLSDALGNKEATEALFALSQGQISEVLPLGTQWVIYRCDQPAEAADLSDPNTINEVKLYVTQSEMGRVETYFEDRARAFVEQASQSSFSQEAAAAGKTDRP